MRLVGPALHFAATECEFLRLRSVNAGWGPVSESLQRRNLQVTVRMQESPGAAYIMFGAGTDRLTSSGHRI